MAGNKQKHRTYKEPAKMTERIEVRCSLEEKDAMYAAALAAKRPISRYLVESTMLRVNGGKDDE